jgi:hypothetical protein
MDGWAASLGAGFLSDEPAPPCFTGGHPEIESSGLSEGLAAVASTRRSECSDVSTERRSASQFLPPRRRRSAAGSDILRITDQSIVVVVAKQRQVDGIGHGPVAAIVRMQMIAAVIRRQQP